MKKSHFTNTFIYLIIPIVRNAFSFLTLPLLTLYLTTNDYGIYALVVSIFMYSNVAFLGINTAFFRFYFDYKDDFEELKKLISTVYIFTFIVSITVVLIFFFIDEKVIFTIFGRKNKYEVYWLGLFAVILQFLNSINQLFFQGSFESIKWAIGEVLNISLLYSILIFLVVFNNYKYEALFISFFISELARFIISAYFMRKYFILNFDFSKFYKMLKYSWPNIPTTIISSFYNSFDKIYIARYYNFSQVGLLSKSSSITQLLKVLMDGSGGTLSPLTVEFLKKNDKISLFKLISIYYKFTYAAVFIALCISFYSKELVIVLTTPEFYPIYYITPIYIFYHVFGIIGMLSYWQVYYHKNKTYYQIPFNALFLISSTLLNIILIPKFGVYGAAAAFSISGIICQLFQFWIGMKLTPLPIELNRYFSIFVVYIGFTLILYFIYYLNISYAYELILKSIVVLLYLMFGYMFNFYSANDVKYLIKQFIIILKKMFITR